MKCFWVCADSWRDVSEGRSLDASDLKFNKIVKFKNANIDFYTPCSSGGLGSATEFQQPG